MTAEQHGFAWATAPAAPALLVFQVDGEPKPKGSAVGHVMKRGDGSLVMRANGTPMISVHETGNRNRSWARDVKAAAKAAAGASWSVITRPVVLEVVFYFARPKKHYVAGDPAKGLRADAPTFATSRRGDLSKLIRSVEDSITDAGVWADDDLVVSFGASTKRWADRSYATFRILEATA